MREELLNRKYCVYKHTNKINGKVYIGQTCDIDERWRCGGKNYFNSIKFYNAIKKYGWNEFEHDILYSGLSKSEADIKERELINQYDSITNGYNLKHGGSRGDLTEESLEKMSESLRRGYIEHPERKHKISLSKVGIRPRHKEIWYKGLQTSSSILITIDGDTGSIRYWASKIGMTHSPLVRRLKLYGMDHLVKFIKNKLCAVS